MLDLNKCMYQFDKLKSYCEYNEYLGWDPYDALNSELFQWIPLNNLPFSKIAFIQFFRRSPVNLRKLFLVPKKYNSKSISLFLLGYCDLYRLAEQKLYIDNDLVFIRSKIHQLAQLLLKLKVSDYSGACWGYDFDWQSKAFYLPRNTPTVVATSFATEALIKAYTITKNVDYLEAALSTSKFVLNDLNKIFINDREFMFSYSPLDSRAVYNASLLGTKILSLLFHYERLDVYRDAAFMSAKAVCRYQNDDGSFPHSHQVNNKWRDSFHTAYKLESLYTYKIFCEDSEFDLNIENGLEYWLKNFFDHESGIPYYYDRGMSKGLIDLHCTAQALVLLSKMNVREKCPYLADKLVKWAIENMQDKKGYFYARKNGFFVNKIQYMRWPNAWMFYGLTSWLLYKGGLSEIAS